MDRIGVPFAGTGIAQSAVMIQMVDVADKLDSDVLRRGRQKKLPVLRPCGKANSLIESAQPTPELANRQTEIAAGAHVVSRAQRSFAGGELVFGFLDFSPREIGIHIDSVGRRQDVDAPSARRYSFNKLFTEKNVSVGQDNHIASRTPKSGILRGHLVKWHLSVQAVLLVNLRRDDDSAGVRRSFHELLG